MFKRFISRKFVAFVGSELTIIGGALSGTVAAQDALIAGVVVAIGYIFSQAYAEH